MTFKGIPFIWSKYDNFREVDANVILKGVNKKSSRGVDLTGIGKIIKCDNSGLDLTGILKIVEGDNKGLSLTGFYNQFRSVEDWSVSYATLGNVIKEVGPGAFYLQVGLFNRAGDHYSPLINIGGVKNLLKRLKR